jgi:hypothetical protein
MNYVLKLIALLHEFIAAILGLIDSTTGRPND